MSEPRTYYIDLKVGLEFIGEDIPCEETLLSPIKKYVKDHIKVYKNTTRIVVMDSKIAEAGYDEESVPDEN
jgi:hypothetical protein